MIRFRQRFLAAAWKRLHFYVAARKRLHFYVAARKRQRFLVADNICALATASVLSASRPLLTSCALLTSLAFTSLALTSCSHTRYIPLHESHQRDSLSRSVNVLVNTTYVDRTHTEKLHRGSDPACSFAGADTILIFDSIYVEKFTDVEVHDTITVTHCDSIPYLVEVPVFIRQRNLYDRIISWGFWILLIALMMALLAYIYPIKK